MRKTIVKILVIVLCAIAVILGCGFGITYAVLSAGAKDAPQDYSAGNGVKFIAHRGLSGEYYENSEQAFRAAADSDFFYGIENRNGHIFYRGRGGGMRARRRRVYGRRSNDNAIAVF